MPRTHFQLRFPVHFLTWTGLACFAAVALFVSSARANDELAIARLRAIQQQVKSVVASTMPACVAVSDGTGFGSGVIVSEDGLVLTAGHVMSSRREYELILPSGKTVRAKPLGKNLAIDAGMLQIIEPGKYPFVPIQRKGVVRRGDWVVSLGHSGGYELGRTPPVRTGRVLIASDESNPETNKRPKNSVIVTDAVLIGGDSGGPLFNLQGELIGIHSSIGDNVAENRHVAMPAFLASWDRMKSGQSWGKLPELDTSEHREKKRGVIGVRVDLKAPNCRIRLVNDRSPADEAGLLVDDIVLEFNGISIRDGRHLINVIKRLNAGDVCPMKIRRGESEMQFEIQLR